MELTEQKAIELKYQGYSYRQIADELKIDKSTVDHWFAVDGKLYFSYLEYAAKQNQVREEQGTNMLKGKIEEMITVLLNTVALLLNKAKEAVSNKKIDEAIKYYKEASVYAEKILDRAGMTVINRSEIKTHAATKQLSDAELRARLLKLGINPETGLPVRTTEAQAN